MVLLSNFYQGSEDDEIFQIRLAQWCEDLMIYPQEALEMAFGDWRRQATRRPTFKEIADLVKSHIVRDKPRLEAVPKPFGAEPTITAKRAAEIAAKVKGVAAGIFKARHGRHDDD